MPPAPLLQVFGLEFRLRGMSFLVWCRVLGLVLVFGFGVEDLDFRHSNRVCSARVNHTKTVTMNPTPQTPGH